jgi:hypothetical protein
VPNQRALGPGLVAIPSHRLQNKSPLPSAPQTTDRYCENGPSPVGFDIDPNELASQFTTTLSGQIGPLSSRSGHATPRRCAKHSCLRRQQGRCTAAAQPSPDAAPTALLDVEVAQVIRRYAENGEIDGERGRAALADLTDFPVRRYPHDSLLPRVWNLRSNLTAYDAVCFALADALDSMRRSSGVTSVSPLQPAIMHGSDWCAGFAIHETRCRRSAKVEAAYFRAVIAGIETGIAFASGEPLAFAPN